MKNARVPSLGASRTSTKGNVLLSPENWFVMGSSLPDIKRPPTSLRGEE